MISCYEIETPMILNSALLCLITEFIFDFNVISFVAQWPGCTGGGGREDVGAGSCWDCAGGGAGGRHRASRTCPGAAGVRVDSS